MQRKICIASNNSSARIFSSFFVLRMHLSFIHCKILSEECVALFFGAKKIVVFSILFYFSHVFVERVFFFPFFVVYIIQMTQRNEILIFEISIGFLCEKDDKIYILWMEMRVEKSFNSKRKRMRKIPSVIESERSETKLQMKLNLLSTAVHWFGALNFIRFLFGSLSSHWNSMSILQLAGKWIQKWRTECRNRAHIANSWRLFISRYDEKTQKVKIEENREWNGYR